MTLWIGGTAESMFLCLNGIEAALGRNGRNAILRYAHLEKYIAVPPENDPTLAVPPGDLATLTSALLEVTGAEYGLPILRQAGEEVGRRLARRRLGLRGITGSLRSPPSRLRRALTELEKGFEQAEHSIEGELLVQRIVSPCPYCHGISSGRPICCFHEGLLEALAQSIVNSACVVHESACQAMGASACVFNIEGLPLAKPALGGVELRL
ncbi:MAG TPA: hypothetical protein ENI39_00445 [Anaerolineae bacterium]|nr:hypothetical protein [Anaerolineae bacterium]